jgi:hypothetical protein
LRMMSDSFFESDIVFRYGEFDQVGFDIVWGDLRWIFFCRVCMAVRVIFGLYFVEGLCLWSVCMCMTFMYLLDGTLVLRTWVLILCWVYFSYASSSICPLIAYANLMPTSPCSTL